MISVGSDVCHSANQLHTPLVDPVVPVGTSIPWGNPKALVLVFLSTNSSSINNCATSNRPIDTSGK